MGSHKGGSTMPLSTVACALVLWCLHGIDGRQEFLRQPQYTEINPGETARLECSILNKKGTCIWQKDRKAKGVYPGKYEFQGDQEKGDCSFIIINATIDIDDGLWECQVTASSPGDQDELSSQPVHLVVRESPKSLAINHTLEASVTEENITVMVNRNDSLTCSSKYGNPPPKIKWFIGEEDITHFSIQTNTSEVDKPKLWAATSRLHYIFAKEHNGQKLKCIAFHKAYEKNSQEAVSVLNVLYLPTVILDGKPQKDVVDGIDIVTLKCGADANPPSLILWRKNGQELTSSEILQFNPIHKEDAGVYSCEGRNSVGVSEAATVHLDVKYRPQNVRVIPSSINARVYNQTTMTCMAESNPRPHFIWLFSATGNANNAQMIGIESTFHIANVTYDSQGTYVCLATNTIHGEEKGTQSEEIQLNVVGIPQILLNSGSQSKIQVEMGEDAILDVPFCSDPPPTIITWEWGSIKLAVGEGKGKFIAEQKPLENKQADCYEARLVIQKAEVSDARHYRLTVENGRGNDSCIMALNVNEPVSMSAVIGIVIGCLVILVIIILIVLYAFRSEKWCFHTHRVAYWASPLPVYAGKPGGEKVDGRLDSPPASPPRSARDTRWTSGINFSF